MTDDLLTPDSLHLSRSKIEACEAVVASPNDWMRSDKPSGILVRVAGLEPSSPYVLALATSPSDNNRFCSIIRIEKRKIAHWRDYMDSLAAWNALTAGARK